MLNKPASVRVWAFWGGVLGAVSAYGYIKSDGDALQNWIEIISQALGFAGLAALLAYARNRLVARRIGK
jgi:hypothetical protein